MGIIPIPIPKQKPVRTRTHALWVRVQTDTGTDDFKSIHGLPVSITSSTKYHERLRQGSENSVKSISK